MSSTLISGHRVYAPGIPDAEAILIEDGHIAWIGDRMTAKTFASDVSRNLDLGDAFIAPGFVDAHVHLSATGALLTGSSVAGVKSWRELGRLVNELVLAKRETDRLKEGRLVVNQPQDGHDQFHFAFGWDDTDWSDSIHDFENELSDLSKVVNWYLARVDGHSAVVNIPSRNLFVERIWGAKRQEIWTYCTSELSNDFLEQSIRSALDYAARSGIVSVHENGGPTVSSKADFATVLSLSRSSDLPEIIAYWADSDIDAALQMGAAGVAGDFSVDGSLGSRTALLSQAYADAHEEFGFEQLSMRQIADQIVSATRLGVQAGFHAIGDKACEQVHAGFVLALTEVTAAQIRACRHRIEHLTLPTTESLKLYAELGLVASVQPNFDANWGGAHGMYEHRLGTARLAKAHPFADMNQAGLALAFGSDSPVTFGSPWTWIKAAMQHHQADQRLSSRAAFAAATRGGRRAAKQDSRGVLEVGAPADLAAWQVDGYEIVEASNGKASNWSTDPRSGTHPLPDLNQGLPTCLATFRNGELIFDGLGIV